VFEEFVSYRRTKCIIKHYNKLPFQTWKLMCFIHMLILCSCKMTSQTAEENTLTNILSLVPFPFLYFPFFLQFHTILLSHIAMYWIWSMLDPDERLLVTGFSPPIFGSQHCFRFRNRMQLNMDGPRLNTLYNKLSFIFQI